MKIHQKGLFMWAWWMEKGNMNILTSVCLCECVWKKERKKEGYLLHFKVVVVSYPLPCHCVVFCQSSLGVTFSGSWTLGPFSVTLCCHSWLVQPDNDAVALWQGNDMQPTSRSAWLKVVFPRLQLLLAHSAAHSCGESQKTLLVMLYVLKNFKKCCLLIVIR